MCSHGKKLFAKPDFINYIRICNTHQKKIKGHFVQYFFMFFSARTFHGFLFDRLIVSERILGRLRSTLDGEKSTTRHFGPINGETGHRENTISI